MAMSAKTTIREMVTIKTIVIGTMNVVLPNACAASFSVIAGVSAGVVAGVDAGVEAGVVAGVDAGVEAGVE